MKFLVVGAGSIGQRHLRNIQSLKGHDITVVDSNPEALRNTVKQYSVRSAPSLTEALRERPEAAIIATPPAFHMDSALQAAQAGCHLFIEKPLSDSLDRLEELAHVINEKSLISLVGCNMRFHHGPTTLKKLLNKNAVGSVISIAMDAGHYMPDWHPNVDYRKRYSAQKKLGGGVLLDGIHELDCARWLFGDVSEVFCSGGHLSHLEIDVEDTVNMLLMFPNGVSATLHLDYLQRPYARSCKIIGEEGTLLWDITSGVRWYSIQKKIWETNTPPMEYDLNQMYVDELNHWISCIKKRQKTSCDVREGIQVMKLAMAAKRSMEIGQKVSL